MSGQTTTGSGHHTTGHSTSTHGHPKCNQDHEHTMACGMGMHAHVSAPPPNSAEMENSCAYFVTMVLCIPNFITTTLWQRNCAPDARRHACADFAG